MITIDNASCTGCGTCALVCPHRVIELIDRRAQLVALERCIECGACQLNCSESALEVTKGTGCLVAIAREVWFRRRGMSQEDGAVHAGCGCD